MGRDKLAGIKDDIVALARELKAGLGERKREVEAVYQRFKDFSEEIGGHLSEFGTQLFGIHVIQEMLCEKAGITKDEVEGRIKARAERLAEQDRLLAEAAALKKAQSAHAETTENLALPAPEEVIGGETPVGGPDQPNQ